MARCLFQLWKQADIMISRYHAHEHTDMTEEWYDSNGHCTIEEGMWDCYDPLRCYITKTVVTNIPWRYPFVIAPTSIFKTKTMKQFRIQPSHAFSAPVLVNKNYPFKIPQVRSDWRFSESPISTVQCQITPCNGMLMNKYGTINAGVLLPTTFLGERSYPNTPNIYATIATLSPTFISTV